MLTVFHGRFLMYEYMANGSLKDHLHSMFLQLLNSLVLGRQSENFFMEGKYIVWLSLYF